MTERHEYAPGEFCWVDLMSHDMEAAQAWYGSIFGWDAKLEDTQGGPPYATFLKNGKAVAGLGEATSEMKAQGIPPVWNNYVSVRDCAATEQKAKELGATITVPTMDVMDAGKLCFFMDPQGASICLWERGNHFGAELVDEPGAFCWNELATRELDASKRFYTELFGWKLSTQPMGGTSYTVIENAGKMNGGMIEMTDEWEGIPAHWMAYFWVEDVDASVKRIEASGGQVRVPPTDIEVGRFSVVADPQGATFTVFKGTQAD